MKPLVSVLIVEPSEIIVQGLRCMLEHDGGYNVLSPLSDTQNLVERVTMARPDLLIINPTLNLGGNTLAQLAQERPMMPVVALVYQYIPSGGLNSYRAMIDIRDNQSDLLTTLSGVMTKSDAVEELPENPELTERELDVLAMVAKGHSSKAIADKLHISIHTVNSHRKNITHKTGIRSVAGLAVYATLHNIS